MSSDFTDLDYWKAIILYGLNQATYKIALGKTLLELAEEGKEVVDWDSLSRQFLTNYLQRLKENNAPQQLTPGRLTRMERIVRRLNNEVISFDKAVEEVGQQGFNDVIPRFQTIGQSKDLVGEKFYHVEHGKKLYLHDSVFSIHESSNQELHAELQARWSLLEGAFMMSHENWDLSNDIRDIYLKKGYDRTNLSPNIPFLKGYQGNTCFYCGEPVTDDDIHVDHVLPRQVVNHDEIWNLVISHSLCNMHKEDALVGKHYIEKLIARNENIMGSNHPWKKKIADALGTTALRRRSALETEYDRVKTVLHSRYWENSPNYNRETDPFFKRLITQLNNS